MKKISYTYISAFIISVLAVVLLNNNLSMLVNTLFIVIIATMIACDIIAKKSKKDLVLDGVLIGVFVCILFFSFNDKVNPYALIPALLCMLISVFRTFKLIEK